MQDWIGGGSRSKAGVNVTSDNSIGLATVWACTRLISETMAALPFKVERLQGDHWVTDPNHYLNRIIEAPSNIYSGFNWKETTQASLCLRGNAASRIHRSRNGQVGELEFIQWQNIEPHLKDNQLFYKIEGVRLPVPAYDVLHIPALSFNGIEGKNPIQVARETIGLGLASLDYGGNFFSNGAHISGAITSDKILSKEQKEGISAQIQAKHGGLDNVARTMVLDAGFDYKPIGLNPQDAMFIETRKNNKEEVASIFRCPLPLIGSMEGATLNNMEHIGINFVKYTLLPWAKRWEAEFERKTLKPSEKGKIRWRFNLEGLKQGDSKARAELYLALFQTKAVNPNQIAAWEGLPPYKGGEVYGQAFASNTTEEKQQENEQK